MAALLSIGCANDTKCTDSLITPRALRAQYSAESAPDGILEAHQRGRPQLRQRRGVLPRRRHKARHPDFSVGVVGIALAVATVERGADAGDLIGRFERTGLFEIVAEQAAGPSMFGAM
jgi:hypothetical protein